MPESRIAEAVKAGQQKKIPLVKLKRWQMGGTDFFVVLSGPFTRIAAASEEATRMYKPFSRADVTNEMLAPVLDVHVIPNTQYKVKQSGISAAPPTVKHVVLSLGKDVTV